MMKQPAHVTFDKQMTGIIKGVAILFMLLLHCYQDNYDVSLDFSYSLTGYSGFFKLCVGMYVFMVGYGYAFSKTKDLRYGFQHIKKLLKSFWVILFVFTLPFCFREVLNDDFKTLFYNLFGIDSHYNWYSWFVYFFIYAMLVMPFISRFIDKKPLRNTAIAVIVAAFLIGAVHEVPRVSSMLFGIHLPPTEQMRLVYALYNSLLMTPCMLLGYLFARNGYYERIRVDKCSKGLTLAICLIVLLLTFVLRRYVKIYHFPIHKDFFQIPFLIGAIVLLFNKFRWDALRRVLVKMGELSVYMWFFHALFFTTPVRWFYQPMITIFGHINLVVLWAILFTFIASWIIKTIVDWVMMRLKSN